ncbi:MAG: hypothetical protein KH297_07700 [Firmicutes bacterium]|nr:hypothetical protein [Bacillota bacterium]
MQKEEAIKIYKRLASPVSTIIVTLLTVTVAGTVTNIINDKVSELFKGAIMFLVGMLVAYLYVNRKLAAQVQKFNKILNQNLDEEEHLRAIEYVVCYGRHQKHRWIQNSFYLAMQLQYAMSLIANGKIKEAEEYIDSGEINKKSNDYLVFKTRIDLDRAYTQGDAEKYMEIYEAAPKLYKKMKIHACRALLMQGKYDEAIEGLMKYTPKNKREEILCRFILGEAHLRKGSKEEAKIHLEYVINNGKTLREKFMAEELYKEL